MSSNNIGQRIADPRLLADELDDPMYSNLAHYTFGTPRPTSLTPSDAASDVAAEPISPLSLPRLSPDRTPRPSVSASPPLFSVSSHPSQGMGRPASSHYAPSPQSRRQSYVRDQSYAIPMTSPVVSGSDSERSEDPSSSSDPIIAALYNSRRGRLMSDTASQHTFGRASHTHRFVAAASQDGVVPSSSSVSVTTSRSSSRASMRTTEQFSSDDELEFDDYYDDGNSSPVTFARYDLADIDEDADLVDAFAPSIRSFSLDGRRGSLPMAIPGVVQGSDANSIRSREGSILTVRRPSRSWDDSSTHRSSLSGEDPTVILPKSEPHSRADWLSVEAQLHAKQQQQHQQQQQQQPQPQQVVEPGVYDGLDLQYILSRRSEGSIRSVNSRLSFVQGAAGPRRSSPHIFRAAESSIILPFEDTFTRHLQRFHRGYDDQRYNWSFQRERADASSSSSRRRQQVQQYRNDKSGNSAGPRVQEMWRCGHVGRFKVDRLVFKPQSTDSTKGTQQRIHIRHIPDPFLAGNGTNGPHSVIHKHSRAVAFSIFRSHSLFSGRQTGGAGAGPSNAQTHMNMRSAIMLAPKKVQEQYTSTKTTRQLSTHGLLDSDSRGSRRGAQTLSLRDRDSRERRRGQEKDDRGKGKSKASGKKMGKIKIKNDKQSHRANPTESTESSSAGSITNNPMISAPEQPMVKIQFSPSILSSTSVSGRDSTSRPVSPLSSLLPSTIESANIPESETSSIPSIRYRYHRDSLDSDDRLPARTTHAEAFGTLDPNDIENLRAKEANSRGHPDSSSKLADLLSRVFRGSLNPRGDDHGTQPRAFQPPWLITAGRDKQEENDRVLNDLNASFRDVGLLHTNPHKPSRMAKRKFSQGILDQVPDDSLYMLLPLWPGETDTASVHAETSSAASFVTIPESRQYLLVWYVPFGETSPKNKKSDKKKAKQSHSSDSGVEADSKAVHLPAFRAVARVVTYDELRLTGIRVPSDGLAINGPEWEAINYPANVPLQDTQMVVVCQCHGRDSGFDFLEHGLFKLGLCTQEEISAQAQELYETEEAEEEPPAKMILTPIGRAAVEMIWLGCLAITSFGPT